MPEKDELSGTAEKRLRADFEKLHADFQALRTEIKDLVKSAVVDKTVLPETVRAPAGVPTAPGLAETIRSPSRGVPANLTQSDVNDLVLGLADARLAALLASSPAFLAPRPENAKRALFAPASMELRDIEVVASTGKNTEALIAALDGVAKTPGRFGEIKHSDTSEKARPEFTPNGQ